MPTGPSAQLTVTSNGPIQDSTYTAGSFKLTNTSTGGEQLTTVTIDLGGSIFGGMIYDPTGQAGDSTAKAFTVDGQTGTFNVVSAAFSNGSDGTGYQTLTLTLTGFDPGEGLQFSVDVDPNSIRGVTSPGPGESGSVAGLELTGAKVSFDFGSTHLVNEIFKEPTSPGGGVVRVETGLPAEPTIAVAGISGATATVSDSHQTVNVTGVAGATVRVLVIEGARYTQGVPDSAPDLAPYQANSAVNVASYDVTLDASGHGAVQVTLTHGPAEGGLNLISAAVVGSDGVIGPVSAPVTLDYEPTPAAALNVTQSGGSTAVTEGGATDTLSVALNTQPTANVTVTVNGDPDVGGAPTSLTFTPSNWNVAQTVTVSAVDDTQVEGTETAHLGFTLSSTDTHYDHLAVPQVSVTVTDNDTASPPPPPVALNVVQSGGSTAVAEGGAQDTISLTLSSQPTGNVIVSLNGDSDVGGAPTTLTFTPSNWNVAQTVTVGAVDDTLVEGTETGHLGFSLSSTDSHYDHLAVPQIAVTVTDNDVQSPPPPPGATPYFNQTTLQGLANDNYTSLQFGPDGRLYVARVDGTILAVKVEPTADGGFQVASGGTEVIDSIRHITNFNDDGTLASAGYQSTRQVTGILVTSGGPDGSGPVEIYVSSSDPRIGAGPTGGDSNLDTNSGVVSRLTQQADGSWQRVDLVRGLPRSEENHSVNGMQLSADGHTLYLGVGGNTNEGAPSNNFAYTPEYAYSAAILSIDLTAVDAMATHTDSFGNVYKYDLPTLPAGPSDPYPNDPFGGRDGLSQARIVDGGPVQVYSPGFRNPYDLVLTRSGHIFAVDNGGNGGWGGAPTDQGDHVTNSPVNGGPDYSDQLFLVTQGFYAGHPNPIRANPEGAGLYPDGATTPATTLPQGWPPVPHANPIEGVFHTAATSGSLYSGFTASTNGIAEYTASTFGGAMSGNLLIVSWDDQIYRVQLASDGIHVASVSKLTPDIGVYGDGLPLDVTTQGDGKPFAGDIFVANYGGGITVMTPTDTPPSPPPPPGSGDADSDGIVDAVDPFAVDPDNGAATQLAAGATLSWKFSQNIDPPGPNGLFNMGFTGLMTDGKSPYTALYDPSNIKAGGAAAGFQVEQVGGGDAVSGNTQQNGFQFGVAVGSDVQRFTIVTKLDNPFGGDPSTSAVDYKSQGFFIGAGDQDNYLKITAAANGGQGGIQVGVENGGAFSSTMYAAGIVSPNLTTLDNITLRLTVDTAAGTATPSWTYTVNGAAFDGSGAPVHLSGATLSALEGDYSIAGHPSELAVGLISTSYGSGQPFPAYWQSIDITADPGSGSPPPPPTSPPPTSPPPTSPPPTSPPPTSGGQTLHGQSGGSNLTGGAGDDTLIGGTGPDTMTGGAGGDHFGWTSLPWSAGRVTDLTDGADRLDLSGLLSTYHYAGSDPVGDGWVKAIDDGHGNAWLYFDTDGRGTADQWGTFIATMDHVSAASITSADLTGGAASPPPPPTSPPPTSPPPTSPPPTSPPPASGQTLQGQSGGSNLTGGAGDDTLIGGTGPDTMTGAGGADHFVWRALPWSPGHVTDFADGTDRLDLSGLLAASHYAGSDAVADGYVKAIDDGHGNAWIYFDSDGRGTADPWGTFVATLDHVSAAQITGADLASGTTSPPPPTSPPPTSPPPVSPPPVSPPPVAGQTLTGQAGGSKLVGGAGDDTLIGGTGPDTMTGAGGADHFTWDSTPWSAGQVTDFTRGTDHIDVSHLLSAAHYAGTDPIADGYVKLLDDGHGNTWLYFDSDGHGSADAWGTFIATLQGVSATSLTGSDFIFR